MPITARMILDSVGPRSPRLATMFARYPKFIHAEHLRHRAFSFSVSSSRAIPVARNLEEVRSDELRAAPVWWGREVRGMASGDELSDQPLDYWPYDGPIPSERDLAKQQWNQAAKTSADIAHHLHLRGVHKSIVNRLLEPFLHVNVIVTGCEPGWLNFFGLRLDRAAQPEMRVLAEAMWREWNESEPTKLEPGRWHLPFVDGETESQLRYDHRYVGRDNDECFDEAAILRDSIRISAGRCANLSYRGDGEFEPLAVDKALALGERLLGMRPIHASPFEHQATPDEEGTFNGTYLEEWKHSEEHGNLPGWVQFRKTLPGEAVAELPEAYR